MKVKLLKFLFRKNTNAKQTVARNFVWLSIAQAVSRLVKALITIYAARVLGAEGFGVFSYALGFAGFFVFFKNIGVDAILTREIAKRPENEKEYISTSFWIEFVLLAITAAIIVLVAPIFSPIKDALPLFFIIPLILIFDDLRDMSIAFFRGKEEMELEAFVVVIGNAAVTIFGFIALKISPTPLSLTAAYAAGSAIGFVASVALLKKRGASSILGYFDRSLVKPVLKSAWPMAISSAVSVFFFNVDIVMLGWWRSAFDIGLYSAAQKIVGISSLFAGLFSVAALPLFSRFGGEVEKSKLAIQESMRVVFFIALPLTFGGWVVGAPLIGFIFGEAFAPSVLSFFILLPSILFTFPLTILLNFIFARDEQKKVIPFAVAASLTNIVLNFFFIQRFGIEGAAAATLAANALYVTLTWRYVRSIVDFRVFVGDFWKIFAACIIMAIGAFVLRKSGVNILVTIITSSVLYFGLLYVIRNETMQKILRAFNIMP